MAHSLAFPRGCRQTDTKVSVWDLSNLLLLHGAFAAVLWICSFLKQTQAFVFSFKQILTDHSYLRFKGTHDKTIENVMLQMKRFSIL